MQRQLIQSYLLVIGSVLTLSACFNEPNYSNTPEIDYRTIFPYRIAAGTGIGQSQRDSVVITIGFKDGDGNLGNGTAPIGNSTTGLPISRADSALYAQNGGWGNYKIQTLRLINGQYVELPQLVNARLIFPDMAYNKPKGAIEGTLDFSQVFFYTRPFVLYRTKFRVTIRDRALNQSNVVETDTITLPFPR